MKTKALPNAKIPPKSFDAACWAARARSRHLRIDWPKFALTAFIALCWTIAFCICVASNANLGR